MKQSERYMILSIGVHFVIDKTISHPNEHERIKTAACSRYYQEEEGRWLFRIPCQNEAQQCRVRHSFGSSNKLKSCTSHLKHEVIASEKR